MIILDRAARPTRRNGKDLAVFEHRTARCGRCWLNLQGFEQRGKTWNLENELIGHDSDTSIAIEPDFREQVVEVNRQSAMVEDNEHRSFGRNVVQAFHFVG